MPGGVVAAYAPLPQSLLSSFEDFEARARTWFNSKPGMTISFNFLPLQIYNT